MSLCLTPEIARLSNLITKRQTSLFAEELNLYKQDLAAYYNGARILVIGGAGSIGSSTIMQLLDYKPQTIGIIDPNENNLTELIRCIRAHPYGNVNLDIAPLSYGSKLAREWLYSHSPYNIVFIFAALKHVRSERDIFSILRMLDVNLIELQKFLVTCQNFNHGEDGIFSVSTDKAANPINIMGASKRIMEEILWQHARVPGTRFKRVTTTRFANVAFSDGSLLWSFLQRIAKLQPLALPDKIQRYFISPQEAGECCVLTAAVCPTQHILIPRLRQKDSLTFNKIAADILHSYGFSPIWFANEQFARQSFQTEYEKSNYSVIVTKPDTDGEKQLEEFVGKDESSFQFGNRTDIIPVTPLTTAEKLADFLQTINQMVLCQIDMIDKTKLARALASIIPSFSHVNTGKSLDRQA